MKKIKNNFKITGKIRIITYKAGTKEILRISKWFENLVVSGTSTGRNLVAQRLCAVNNYSLNITHADIGVGTATPQNSDTQLETPSIRAVTTLAIVDNNAATLQFFFSDAMLPNGTYREFGTFIDGSSGLSTGKLFNRVLFGTPYIKASGEDTTVEVIFTIT